MTRIQKIMREKESEIIAATGGTAKTIQELYNRSRGKNRALIRAGIWLSESYKALSVSDVGIRNSANAAKMLRPHFDTIGNTEQIMVLLLDNKNRPLAVADISGKRHPVECDLSLRELMRQIILTEAAGIILAHNHPSGELNASREDIKMTRDLAAIVSEMGTELVDHIILIPDGEYRRINWSE